LCETGTIADEVRYVALNDGTVRPPRLSDYANERLRAFAGCERSKTRFVTACLRHGRDADRVICGHLHQLPVAWLLRLLRPNSAYYLVAHGIDVWRPYSPVERLALAGAHRILCISEYTRRQMLRFHRSLRPERLVVLANTLDPRFTPPDSAATILPVGGRHPRILVVSRLTTADTYKGADTVIEAMPAILREYPAAQLRIVGGGDDEPRLRSLVQSLQLAAAVHFTGIIDDDALRDEYAACDLFALPSRKEGFGLVYLEAMTYGKPCLAARAGGAPEVIDDRVGALVEYGNVEQIVAAVADLVRHPRAWDTLRQRATGFSFDAFKTKLLFALT
jgi:glycosyltransferase involved in cell wall biosynthesis